MQSLWTQGNQNRGFAEKMQELVWNVGWQEVSVQTEKVAVGGLDTKLKRLFNY